MEPEVTKASRVTPVPTLRFDDHRLVVAIEHDAATLGRQAGNAYVVADPGASRVHAQLRREAATIILTDLGSSSGTRVNDEPLEGPRVLRHGDRVSFGTMTATFEDPAAAAEREDATMVFGAPVTTEAVHLSPRQQQVVDLVAQGMTNMQIGAALGITERTVKAYAQELYDKLGVRNRAGAVAAAWNEGLLGGDSATKGGAVKSGRGPTAPESSTPGQDPTARRGPAAGQGPTVGTSGRRRR